jgi:hypothetical protein
MKALKLVMIFSVIIFAIIGAVWSLGHLTNDQALEFSGKAVALVAIAGAAMFAIAKVAPSKKSQSQRETPTKPGPKF